MEINNCSSCGGKVEFDPDSKGLKCVKCGNVYKIDSKKKTTKRPIQDKENEEGFREWQTSGRCFHCQNCGAQLILNNLEMSNTCQYCHTSSLVPYEQLPGLKPDAVLPFKISKAKASETFKANLRKKWFLPNKFKKNIPLADIGATYISSFNFAYHTYSLYHGIEHYTVTVTRNGQTHTESRSRPISGHLDYQFDNVVVEASDKLDQYEIMQILPFNFNEGYEYNSGFIKGYNVEYYNLNATQAFEKSKKIADSEIENMIASRYNSVSNLSVKTNFSNELYNYSLLPVYFVSYKYKDKEYRNLMNGQNGAIGGKLPRSGVKITFTVLLSLLLVIGIPLLIVLLTI